MNPEDPEQHIRDLERGVGQTPGAEPEPFATDPDSPFGMPFSASPPPSSPSPFGTSFSGQFAGRGGGPVPGRTSPGWLQGLAKFANTPGRLIFGVFAVLAAFAIGLVVWNHSDTTTVKGNLTMINSGATGKINCNNGNVKLDGDNNTYTITGHCRRLDVFGSANHVTVDSADTIGAIGDDNVMIYHSGSPTINKTGSNNVVSQRSSTR